MNDITVIVKDLMALSIKKKIYYNSFSIVVKKFKQQHVLSVHELNIGEFPNNFNRFYDKFYIK